MMITPRQMLTNILFLMWKLPENKSKNSLFDSGESAAIEAH